MTAGLKQRCSWAGSDPLMRAYHDEEWGVPEFNGRTLWEHLILEGFQAGLAWIVVLRKREAFRKAFRGFDPEKVARFGARDVDRLLENPGIIRSRAKIEAAIGGARAYLELENKGAGFSNWVWEIAGGQPIQNRIRQGGPVPASTPLSETFSKELKRRGFRFVGPVIVYAWMQAAGIVNDHSEACFRRGFCARIRRKA